MQVIKKERDSNIELYRIFLMLFIIAHHYVVHSGLVNVFYENLFSSKTIYLSIFGAWGKVGINCFILITGYFMCKSNISLKKFLKLLLEVEFYKIILYIFFCIIGQDSFQIMNLVKTILPIRLVSNNFVTCYIIFYLFIPFVNILIKNVSKKQHLIIIALLFFVISILGNIPIINMQFNYLTLFLMIYLIGAYIRLYGIKLLENRKKCIFINILLFTLCIGSIILGMFIYKQFDKKMLYYFINDSNKVLAVLLSISFFYLFKNIKMKSCKFINIIASSIFGVLLIHNGDIPLNGVTQVRFFLWEKVFKVLEVYNESFIYVLFHSIISVLIIFIVCTIIDQVRIKFIEEPFFKVTSNKIDKMESWIKKKIIN